MVRNLLVLSELVSLEGLVRKEGDYQSDGDIFAIADSNRYLQRSLLCPIP